MSSLETALTRTLAAASITLALAVACKSGGTPAARAGAAPAVTGVDPAIVDPSVKPCDDFYQYACGGWLAKTPIPPEKSIWSRGFSEVEERNVALLRDIAQADAAGQLDPADRFAKKVGDFYAACMDEAGIEARGTKDLLALWARIDQVQDVPALAKELGFLHKQGDFPLFRLESDQDAKDATQVIGVVEQGGLSLPDRDYYLKDDPKSAAIQQAYREHVERMLRLAGVPAAQAVEDVKAVYALERALAEAHWSRVEMRDPKRTYNRIDLVGLEKAAPRFPWKSYLDALGHGGLTAFSTTTPRFLTRVDELLGKTPPATWRTYLRWRVLSAAASHRALPRAFYDERFAFLSKHFTGAEKQEVRWKDCVHATDGALGEALGQAFVRRHFGEESKASTRQMVSDIEGAMGRDLDGLGWMDDATRARAREKLAKVVNKVGYPDSWRDYGALKVDRGSYLNSLLAAQAFEVNRDLDKIGKPVDRNEWEMSPPTVNAYYNPAMNEMVFPAGILQPPFFTRGAPAGVNYGAIGMVEGHELTHGFDDEGRQYDALGNLRDWWTPAVGAEFDRRADCVAKQYDGYVAVDDVKLNGRLTLGENIADLGGLKLAYAAWQHSRAGKPATPVAGFTAEQAFFIGYALSWCTSTRPQAARLRAATDPHAPPMWRVNGPLANLSAFAEAFSCPAGSAMVRAGEQRCEVW
jgi:putative endopeptidase